MNQSTSIPLLKDNEQQIIGVRGRLEDMFRSLNLVHDVTVVCRGACDAINSDSDAEVAHVLQRCGTDELFTQMKELTSIIEQLGGRTELSDDADERQIDMEVSS